MSEKLADNRENGDSLFAERGPLGTKEQFCSHVVRLLAEHCPALSTKQDPVAAVGALTKSDVFKALYFSELSIDELVPLGSLSSDQLKCYADDVEKRLSVLTCGQVERERVLKLLIQFDAIEAVTRPPEPLAPDEAERLRALRAKFRPEGHSSPPVTESDA